MVSKNKKMHGNGGTGLENVNGEGGVAEYEQSREQRIKENFQRMQSLGILDLSRNLKPPPKPKTTRPCKRAPAPSGSPRRSSRIKILPTISYLEKHVSNSKDKVNKDIKIEIKEGSQPEVYTDEHEKVLGDHKETWTLCVDGYDEEGNRIYDTFHGKSCHQCRQKTAGHRTKCCKCKYGQFCGDCLFMRYGENVLEANTNPDWICPLCRDICNCSRCRRVKGWEPTGNLYRKALHLGYKSVAHYLIQARGPNGKQEDITNETPASFEDEDEASEGNTVSPLDHKDDAKMDTDKNMKHHEPISKDEHLPTENEDKASEGNLVSPLDDKDGEQTDEDGKPVLTAKNIKHHRRAPLRKRNDDDDDDDDSDYKFDPVDEDDGDEDDDDDDSSDEAD